MKALKPAVNCYRATKKVFQRLKDSSDMEPLVPSRNNSIRGSMKNKATQKERMLTSNDNGKGMKVAFVMLNNDYSPISNEYSSLPGVPADGVLMEEMLSCYDEVAVVRNVSDIEKEVKNFCAKYNQVECVHFHYSGHGVDSATVQIDPNSYEKDHNGKTFVSVTPAGDCLIGCGGELYSVHDLKHELLKCNPGWLTLTLDCCRNSRGGKEYVRLREKKKISKSNQKKIAVIHGTSDLHTACDTNTFTKELYKVFEEEGQEIPILQIVSKVNKSWEDRNINQICDHHIVEVGNNWKSYMWPASYTIKAQQENTLGTMVTGKNENEIQEETMTMAEVVKRLMTLEAEKQADKERIQKLETEVSELSDLQETKKRKQTTESRMPSKYMKTTFCKPNCTAV